MNQLTVDLQEEKQRIIDKIFENKIYYSPLNDKLSELMEECNDNTENTTPKNNNNDENYETDIDGDEAEINENQEINPIKQEIIEELDKLLPNSMICNSQFPF
jgi:hypothetical protein